MEVAPEPSIPPHPWNNSWIRWSTVPAIGEACWCFARPGDGVYDPPKSLAFARHPGADMTSKKPALANHPGAAINNSNNSCDEVTHCLISSRHSSGWRKRRACYKAATATSPSSLPMSRLLSNMASWLSQCLKLLVSINFLSEWHFNLFEKTSLAHLIFGILLRERKHCTSPLLRILRNQSQQIAAQHSLNQSQ